MCKVKMFGTWLRADTSATYTKLARAFVAVGNRTIAEGLCTTRGTEATLFDVCILECTLCCGTRGGSKVVI